MNPDDIILWADGTWCFATDLNGMGWKSDDYERIAFDTPRWHFVQEEGDDD